LQFTYPLSTRDASATGEASALKIEHPALQNMKFLNFFLFWWVIFALLDPDPDPDSDPDPDPDSDPDSESGSGSNDLIKS
jgi:hypothetical protein